MTIGFILKGSFIISKNRVKLTAKIDKTTSFVIQGIFIIINFFYCIFVFIIMNYLIKILRITIKL